MSSPGHQKYRRYDQDLREWVVECTCRTKGCDK